MLTLTAISRQRQQHSAPRFYNDYSPSRLRDYDPSGLSREDSPVIFSFPVDLLLFMLTDNL